MNPKESECISVQNPLYLRSEAMRILGSTETLSRVFDHLSLPIAGFRGIQKDIGGCALEDIPQEIISPRYVPYVLYDLDEVLWPHIEAVVASMNEITGTQISMEEFQKIGNTRKIPEWMDDPAHAETHDTIIRGEHPEYYPYVNTAYKEAVTSVWAQDRMGHRFAYLTGRLSSVIPATLRVLEWNGLPTDKEQRGYWDAMGDQQPRQRWVYGADGMPMLVDRKYEHKEKVVAHWLSHMREQGWEGQLVVVDDLQKSYGALISSGQIMGIALQGDVNAQRDLIQGELRVHSWKEIHDKLMDVHKQAVASDPSPYRIFNCQNSILVVAKEVSGNGEFTLENLPLGSYEWMNLYDAERAFERLSR